MAGEGVPTRLWSGGTCQPTGGIHRQKSAGLASTFEFDNCTLMLSLTFYFTPIIFLQYYIHGQTPCYSTLHCLSHHFSLRIRLETCQSDFVHKHSTPVILDCDCFHLKCTMIAYFVMVLEHSLALFYIYLVTP